MEKYIPASTSEGEMLIENFPSELDHIPITISEDTSDAIILSMLSDMLQGPNSINILLVGEGNQRHRVCDCIRDVGSTCALKYAVYNTTRLNHHIWNPTVRGLDPLQVTWEKKGHAALLSRSTLPAAVDKSLVQHINLPQPDRNQRGRGGRPRMRRGRDDRNRGRDQQDNNSSNDASASNSHRGSHNRGRGGGASRPISFRQPQRGRTEKITDSSRLSASGPS